jgi:UDP-3-O-[3-hydroxymyristoyl] glucosamine N-acyltransferase
MKKANSSLTIKEIAEITSGKISGDADILIIGANTLEHACEGEISFLANPKYGKWLDKTKASCVLVSDNLDVDMGIPMIKVKNPDMAFSKILSILYGDREHPVEGISKNAFIHDDAEIAGDVKIGDMVKIEDGVKVGKGTLIYPNVYIGKNAVIGENCLIYPGVSIMDSVQIGNHVIISACSVIGSDGFGFATEKGKHMKTPQVGSVVIKDNVEIGANVCIDRGTPGDTFIDEGTKIDNLVQIAHNVKVGKNCFLVAQVGVAGSTVIEDGAVLAGQAGVVGHITIGAGAQVGAQAGVTNDIQPGMQVSGYPARDHRQARKTIALIGKLPKLFKEVERLKKVIGDKND